MSVVDEDVPLEAALQDEAELQRQLRQLQREVRRAKKEGAATRRFQILRRDAAAMRDELDQRELHDAMAGVRPADESATRAFAERCNLRLAELELPQKRVWVRLFRRVDADGSGLITFDEFVKLVREILELNEDAMSVAQLKRIWLALDVDRSGRVTAGEFGHFMRKGEHVLIDESKPHWRDVLHAQRKAKVDAVKAERDRLFHKHIVEEVATSGVVASAEDVRRLSVAFNARLTEIAEDGAEGEPPLGTRQESWYKLFKRVDADGSGRE